MSARPASVGPGRRNGESDAQFAGIFVFEQSSEIRYSGVDMAIEEIVSAAEANRSFSRLLRGVREGRRYVVTAHGKPVARLVPAGAEDEIDRRVREAAKQELLRRLERQPVCDIGRWIRDELYDR